MSIHIPTLANLRSPPRAPVLPPPDYDAEKGHNVPLVEGRRVYAYLGGWRLGAAAEKLGVRAGWFYWSAGIGEETIFGPFPSIESAKSWRTGRGTPEPERPQPPPPKETREATP